MPRKPKLKSQREAEEAAPPPLAPQVDGGPIWARIPAVVERFGISENTIRRRIKDGRIVASKANGIRAIDVRSVEAMFAAGVGK